MDRVAVIGNAGGGKTSLCNQLGAELDIPVLSMDSVMWTPNWIRAPLADVARVHNEWMKRDRWIIDGFGAFDLIARRFDLADTIIFIDFPMRIHYWWSMKRQIKYAFRSRPEMPENCPNLMKTRELIQIMKRVNVELRPILLSMMDERKATTQIVQLRSPRERQEFLNAAH
jgi:adenylate kinase family enzyme